MIGLSATVRAMLAFDRTFGGEPLVVASAPGRANLIGEHIDYSGGHVLPFAIDRRCTAALGRASDRITIQAVDLNDRWTGGTDTDLGQAAASLPKGHWARYVLGSIEEVRRAAGTHGAHRPLPPLNLAIASDVPLGSGLSSSASLEVAVATAMERHLGVVLDPLEKAAACQRAERDFAGVPCGVMDQSASILGRAGHAVLIDTRDIRRHRLIRLPDPGRCTILVIDTRVRHALSDGEYAARRRDSEHAAVSLGVRWLCEAPLTNVRSAESLSDAQRRCALHAVEENARVRDAVKALEAGSLGVLGRLLQESHASLRDVYRVSCEELDFIVDHLNGTPGVFGARMTGGGFGGNAIALVEPPRVAELTASLTPAYSDRFGKEPGIMRVTAGPGAMIHPAR